MIPVSPKHTAPKSDEGVTGRVIRLMTWGSLQNGSKNGCRQLAVAGVVLVELGGHWGYMEENGEPVLLEAVHQSPIPEAGNDFERE